MQSASSAQLLLHTSVSGSDALSEHADLLARVEELLPRADDVARRLISCFDAGGRVYTFGNGGSSADAAHFAEELVGRFKRERRAPPGRRPSGAAPGGTSAP